MIEKTHALSKKVQLKIAQVIFSGIYLAITLAISLTLWKSGLNLVPAGVLPKPFYFSLLFAGVYYAVYIISKNIAHKEFRLIMVATGCLFFILTGLAGIFIMVAQKTVTPILLGGIFFSVLGLALFQFERRKAIISTYSMESQDPLSPWVREKMRASEEMIEKIKKIITGRKGDK